jgi:hypothetical protein
MGGRILLGGEPAAILEALGQAGLATHARRDALSRWTVPFRERPGAVQENEEACGLLLRLNGAGFKFAHDYKVPEAPSGVMDALQEAGALHGPFDEIVWRGPDQWHIATHGLKD